MTREFKLGTELTKISFPSISQSITNRRWEDLQQEIQQMTVDNLDDNILYLENILRSEVDPLLKMFATEKRKKLVYNYCANQILTDFPQLQAVIDEARRKFLDIQADDSLSGKRHLQPLSRLNEFINQKVGVFFETKPYLCRLVRNNPYVMQILIEDSYGYRLRSTKQTMQTHLAKLSEVFVGNVLKAMVFENFLDSNSLKLRSLVKKRLFKEPTPQARSDKKLNFNREGDWWKSLDLKPELVNQSINRRCYSWRENRKQYKKYRAYLAQQNQIAHDFIKNLCTSEIIATCFNSDEFTQQPVTDIFDVLDDVCWQEAITNPALRQLAVADVGIFLASLKHYFYKDVGLLLEAVSHYNARYFVYNYCRSQHLLLHRLVNAEVADEAESAYLS